VLALLETSRPLSLREIGGAVAGYPPQPGPLRQAFERDKRTLRDNGIPVSVERIEGEEQQGYRIRPEEYYLPDLELTEEEAEALGFALAAVRLEGASLGDVARKLGAATPEAAPLAVLPTLPALSNLQQAIRQRAIVHFSYHDKARAVSGYGLVFREGRWYFVGHDEAAGALRTFRVDRIDGEVVAGDGDAYRVPEGLNLAEALRFSPLSVEASDGDATEVVLEVDVRVARAVRQTIGEQARTVERPDGSVELTFRVGDEDALVAYVLGLGDAAVLRAPQSLVARVLHTLEAIR
jgi:proteasome accessory factor B